MFGIADDLVITDEEKKKALPLFNSCVNLAYKIAGNYGKKFAGPSNATLREDIVSFAMMGLWVASLRYDDSKKYKFSTFAHFCIKGIILNGIKDTLGTKHVKDGNVQKRVRLETQSLEVLNTFGDYFTAQPTTSDELKIKRIHDRDHVKFVTKHLTFREKYILLRYARGATLEQLAKKYRISRERARQIKRSAIEQVRNGEKAPPSLKEKMRKLENETGIPWRVWHKKLRKESWKVYEVKRWYSRRDELFRAWQKQRYKQKITYRDFCNKVFEEEANGGKESKKRKSRQHVSAERQGNQTAGGKG